MGSNKYGEIYLSAPKGPASRTFLPRSGRFSHYHSSRTFRPAHFLISSFPHFLFLPSPISDSGFYTVYRFFLLPQFQISSFQQPLNKKHCHPGLDPGSKIHYSITIYLRFGHWESSGRITKGFFHSVPRTPVVA